MFWPLKFIFVPIFTSNGFQRERERERKKREPRSRIRRSRRTPSSSPTIARTKSHQSHRSQHRVDRTALLDLAFDLASAQSHLCAISPSTHESSTHQSLYVILISMWFWFLLLLWWCGSGVLVVVAFDCRSLLSWVELEFRWCVALGFGCDLFNGLGFGCDFEIFCKKNLFWCWENVKNL